VWGGRKKNKGTKKKKTRGRRKIVGGEGKRNRSATPGVKVEGDDRKRFFLVYIGNS